MAEEKKKKSWVKWVVIVVVVVIVIILLWMLFKGGRGAGNKYASAEAIAASKNGTYGNFGSTGGDSVYAKMATAFSSEIPGSYGGGVPNWDAYANAWFKGMDIGRTDASISKFKSEVKSYAESSLKKPHWEVTTGSFVNETATA